MKEIIYNFLHNCIAHPLLFLTMNSKMAINLHDWSSDKMKENYPKKWKRVDRQMIEESE